jgi:DoxX-like protein
MSAVTVQTPAATRSSRWMVWAGRIVSVAPVFIVLMSSRWKLTEAPFYVREWGRIGWQTPDLPFIASLQLGAILLYVIPQTSVLGAVLLTGYLGGAIASYVRIGQYYPPLVPLTTAMLAWLGIWLRDERLRALLPIRRSLNKPKPE